MANLVSYTPSVTIGVMFKVSTKGDYGLLLMTALAKHFVSNGPEFVSLKMIAEEKNLSLSYISQLIIPLKNAGLLESREGLYGGYRLSKNPSQISLLEILETIEGPIAPVKCCDSKSEKCQCESACNVQSAWHEAIEVLAHYLRSRKLSDLLEKKTSSPIVFTNF